MDQYIQIVLLCIATAVAKTESATTVKTASTDQVIDEVLVMRKIPRGESLEMLIRRFMNQHAGMQVFRLVIYETEEDARRTEENKVTDVDYSGWRGGYLRAKTTAGPAAEFIRIGNRAMIREYDGKRPETRSVSGFAPLDKLHCHGASARFLYAATARYTPARRLTVDTFFMYERGFSVQATSCIAGDLNISRLDAGTVNIAADPSFVLATDYPYFNRFIDSQLYSRVDESQNDLSPMYICSKLAPGVKLGCRRIDSLGFGP